MAELTGEGFLGWDGKRLRPQASVFGKVEGTV